VTGSDFITESFVREIVVIALHACVPATFEADVNQPPSDGDAVLKRPG
jgi:hypothetical protein